MQPSLYARIVKSALLCLLSIHFLGAAVEVKLTIPDAEYENYKGKRLPLVEEGQTFVLCATISGERPSEELLSIAGLEKCKIVGQSVSNFISVHNGLQKIKRNYNYSIVSHHTGLLELTPRYDGKKCGEALCIVIKKPTVSQAALRGEYDGKTMCCISLDKHKAVVGEALIATIRVFCGPDLVDANIAITPFAPEGFFVKEVPGLQNRTEVIKNESVSVLTKNYVLVPLKAGVHTIPPLIITFNAFKTKKDKSDPFDNGFFGLFFNQNQAEQKRSSSNSLSLSVDALPPHKGLVDGIGSFTSFSAHSDALHVKTNEPFTFSISLAGRGNFDQVEAPILAMPAHSKQYLANSDFEQDAKSDPLQGVKKFSYTMQIKAPGVFKIPAQVFCYFDTTARTYKKLHTSPLEIVVEGHALAHKSEPEHEENVPQQPASLPETCEPSAGGALEIIRQGSPVSSTPWSIPWYLFLLLAAFPLSVLCIRKVLNHYFYTPLRVAKTRALKNLSAIKNKEDRIRLYEIMQTFYGEVMDRTRSQVNDERLREFLKNCGFLPTLIEAHSDFMAHCARYAFSNEECSNEDLKKLVSEAQSLIASFDTGNSLLRT